MNVLLICIYFSKDLLLLSSHAAHWESLLYFPSFPSEHVYYLLRCREIDLFTPSERQKNPQYKWLMRAVSARNMCVVCADSPNPRQLSERGVANCSWKETWWTYADYSQHWPQVIIKCLPGVIFIYERTEQQTVGQTARGVGRVGASRGVAAFNTIIEFSWGRFEKHRLRFCLEPLWD